MTRWHLADRQVKGPGLSLVQELSLELGRFALAELTAAFDELEQELRLRLAVLNPRRSAAVEQPAAPA
jgi:hypothetical protein